MIMKVCGATTPRDIEVLAAAGADLVGLWHGIPAGRANLPAGDLAKLVSVARAPGRPQPVLVTFIADPGLLAGLMAATGLRWVQLHGYQPPAVIRMLKAQSAVPITVIKVLHLPGGACTEKSLISAYARAGTDVFLMDAVTAGGRIGSTAQRLPSPAVRDLTATLPRPFLLAGGISAAARAAYGAVAAHPRFLGIDVDTAARDAAGRLQAGLVAKIRRGWQPSPTAGGASP